jgi:hypothetical protein
MGTDYVRTLRNSAAEDAKKCARSSLRWPVAVSAWEETWREIVGKVESLQMGVSLPFRVRRSGHQGNARHFDQNSSTLFALDLCEILLEELARLPEDWDDASLESLRNADRDLDESHGLLDEHNPVIPEECNIKRSITIGGEKCEWDLRIHWRLKAILLPDFPHKGSSTCESDLKQWAIAMQRLMDNLCGGDYDHYPWWPEQAHKRVCEQSEPKTHITDAVELQAYQRARKQQGEKKSKKRNKARRLRGALKEYVGKGLRNLLK